jgi:hypothetical protein
VAITQSELAAAGEAGWSDALRRSTLGSAVFELSPLLWGRALHWAEAQPVPRSSRRPVHAPSVDAWAVLDGGVLHVYGYGLTSLPAGMYVVGVQAVRLIIAELGVPTPTCLTAASAIGADELRDRHRVAAIDDPSAVEQADLLATCTDAVMLRWVATTLLAEYGPAGLDTAGLDTAGLDTAGLDTAGLDTAGLDTAGLDTA